MRSVEATYNGKPIDTSENAFGELRRSDDLADDPIGLRARFSEDGYIYLPGYLGLDPVAAVRRGIFGQLAKLGALDPSRPP